MVSDGVKKQRNRRKRVQTCPSFHSGHLPSDEDVERLRELSAPHVESFDYFLDVGLRQGIKDIEPCEMCIVDPGRLRASYDGEPVDWDDTGSVQFWVEDVALGRPTCDNRPLLPRECRERGLMYAGHLTATFCYTIIERRNGINYPRNTVRLPNRSFGEMPVMTMSKACHLRNMMPKELVAKKEEVSSV